FSVTGNGMAVVGPSGATGRIAFDPSPYYDYLYQGTTAVEVVAYVAQDNSTDPAGTGKTPGTLTLTITGVNDAPTSTVDAAATDEDTPIEIDVLQNDADIDVGDTLEVSNLVPPAFGTVTATSSNTRATFTPNHHALNRSAQALESFSYRA